MSIQKKLAAVPFAHLLGIGAKADDEDRKAKRAEDDEQDDDKKSKRAEEDDGDDEDKKDDKGKKASRAEEDDGDDEDKKSKRAEEDDGADEKKGKKAKRAEEDDADEDDDDDEMKGSSASAKARRRERARCSAIFGCEAAGSHPHVAANLAFNTNMSRSQAIAVLQSVGAGTPARRGNLADRMANNPVPRVGADADQGAPAGMSKVAAAIVAAGEKARSGK